MNWITRSDDLCLSAPYRVTRTTMGFEAWIFSDTQSGCLGRRIATRDEAKALCVAHAKKLKEPKTKQDGVW